MTAEFIDGARHDDSSSDRGGRNYEKHRNYDAKGDPDQLPQRQVLHPAPARRINSIALIVHGLKSPSQNYVSLASIKETGYSLRF
jgi:hypothetical protein